MNDSTPSSGIHTMCHSSESEHIIKRRRCVCVRERDRKGERARAYCKSTTPTFTVLTHLNTLGPKTWHGVTNEHFTIWYMFFYELCHTVNEQIIHISVPTCSRRDYSWWMEASKDNKNLASSHVITMDPQQNSDSKRMCDVTAAQTRSVGLLLLQSSSIICPGATHLQFLLSLQGKLLERLDNDPRVGAVIHKDGRAAHPGLQVINGQWDVLSVVLEQRKDEVSVHEEAGPPKIPSKGRCVSATLLKTQISPLTVGRGTPWPL